MDRTKHYTKIASGVLFLIFLGFNSTLWAQDSLKVKNQNQVRQNIKHGPGFVDKNGDGINDNAPDDDGDGIPNGLDPDYTGPKNRHGGRGFVDENGDGINDNAQDFDGDGIPNGQDPDYRNTSKGNRHGGSHLMRRNRMNRSGGSGDSPMRGGQRGSPRHRN